MDPISTLETVLAAELGGDAKAATNAAVAAAVRHMAVAARSLATVLAAPPLSGRLGAAAGSVNSDGDGQKRLDLVAERLFSTALRQAGIGAYLSEEEEVPALLSPGGAIAVAIDPLDGSSNLDVNAPVGTIFSILPLVDNARHDAALAFRQPGKAQIAAGFFIYGPQTSLVVTFGRGVHLLVLDRATGAFVLVEPPLVIPPDSSEFAINASNARHWQAPVKAYNDDCLLGKEGPAGRNFNMRWIASLVADSFRIFTRGGIFLYPADARPGYEHGRLRLMYEANPIAFLAEQAGGAATVGLTRVLDVEPTSPHQRSPLIMGSIRNVEVVRQKHLDVSSATGEAA